MQQFDVYRNSGKNRATIPYVLIVQSSYFAKSRRRVVVPLVSLAELSRAAALPASAINPVFVVEGVQVVLNPLEIVSVPSEVLREQVTSLADARATITAALDELFPVPGGKRG